MAGFCLLLSFYLSIAAAVTSQYIQHDVVQEVPDPDDAGSDALSFVPIVVVGSYQNSSTSEFGSCPLCIYDFKSNRLNKGLGGVTQPRCERGTLVLTSVGSDHEMCCCNYSLSD